MDLQKKKLSELKPAEYNPRKALQPDDAEFQSLARSIEELGYADPIIVNKDGTIIGGHQRYSVLKYLGWEEADVVVVDVSKAKEKAMNLALNKISGAWDDEKLKELLIDLSTLDIDMSLSGFNQEEIAELVGDINLSSDDELDIEDDDYEVDPPKIAKSKLGQLYALGEHRLFCGDCTNPENVKILMCGDEADMVLTDPPYNVAYEGGTGLTIQNDNMEDSDFRKFLKNAFASADSALKPGGAFYIWHADSEGFNFRGACRDVNWQVRECLIWVKNALVLGRQDYQWRHEPCLYGWKEGAAHTWNSDRKQTTVLEFDRPTKSVEHPTMKPIPLFSYEIQNSTKQGQRVLDIFGGSGTTIMACEQNKRIGYCMELDPCYVDVIIDRWEKLTGRKAELINYKK